MSEGFDINEPIEIGDLSDQTGDEAIDPAKRVGFIIKKATIRTQLENNQSAESDENKWLVRRLALQVAVGPDGVDGEGKYANKRFFPELPLTFNTNDFPAKYDSDYYKKRARNDTKTFFTALGYNPSKLPAINDEFLIGLVEQEVIADITRKEKRFFNAEAGENGEGAWQGSGEYQNLLTNFRAAVTVATAS